MTKSRATLFLIIVISFIGIFTKMSFADKQKADLNVDDKTLLIFPTTGLDSTTVEVLTATQIDSPSYGISKKDGKLVAVFTKKGSTGLPVVETLKGISETTTLGNEINFMVVSLKKIIESLKDYKIDQVELSVSAAAESGEVTKLLVSGKGEGGIKIILKPR